MRRQRGRIGLMAAALVALVVSGAAAQDVDRNDISTERSSSILVFPKVIADGTRDTVIQITNTSNSVVYAHCFYVNGAPQFGPFGPDGIPDSGDEDSRFNPPLWTEIDFDIMLTKQQPTYWVVSTGRLQNDLVGASDPPCTRNYNFCPNAGLDPGHIPPTLQDFTGELKCIEVDGSGAPLPGNNLKGEATLYVVDPCDPTITPEGPEFPGTCRSDPTISCDYNSECPGTTGDVAKYNAIGFHGFNDNDRDDVLCLGGDVTDECPFGREYNACPDTWILNHMAENAPDLLVDEESYGSAVETSITIVPCTENFESQEATSVIVQLDAFNQFEQRFSASTTITCWAEVRLEDIAANVFDFDKNGSATPFFQTFLRPSNGTQSRFLMISDEVHVVDRMDPASDRATAATNTHFVPVGDDDTHQDVIVIPTGQGGQQ